MQHWGALARFLGKLEIYADGTCGTHVRHGTHGTFPLSRERIRRISSFPPYFAVLLHSNSAHAPHVSHSRHIPHARHTSHSGGATEPSSSIDGEHDARTPAGNQ
jgi:hypothetical protein